MLGRNRIWELVDWVGWLIFSCVVNEWWGVSDEERGSPLSSFSWYARILRVKTSFDSFDSFRTTIDRSTIVEKPRLLSKRGYSFVEAWCDVALSLWPQLYPLIHKEKCSFLHRNLGFWLLWVFAPGIQLQLCGVWKRRKVTKRNKIPRLTW